MSGLDEAIRTWFAVRLEFMPCDIEAHESLQMAAHAVLAVLDLHRQSETHVWDVPRLPSGLPRIELNPWCQCQDRDGMALDEGDWPWPMARTVGEQLGVEAADYPN